MYFGSKSISPHEPSGVHGLFFNYRSRRSYSFGDDLMPVDPHEPDLLGSRDAAADLLRDERELGS